MELEHMEVTVDFQQKSPLMNFQQKSPLVDFQQKSPLMEWVGTIDILKHVTERDLSDMFNDGGKFSGLYFIKLALVLKLNPVCWYDFQCFSSIFSANSLRRRLKTPMI